MTFLNEHKILGNDGTTLVDVSTDPNTGINELNTVLAGHQCTDNSSSTPLAGDAYFLGSGWQDTLNFGVISIDVISDQDSAIDGLEIQWSGDGINVIDTDKFTILATVSKTFTFGPAQRYYRVKYTNGSVAQTSFVLTALMRKVYVKPSSHRINDAIVGQDDAELVKAVLTGVDSAGSGVFYNVKVTKDGSQLVKLIDSQNGKEMTITPTRSLKVVTPVKIAGSNFNGAKDVNFWTETVTGTGAVTLTDGQIILTTGITANSTAKYESVRKARYVASSANQFRGAVHRHTVGTTDNKRQIGVFDDNNGYFFQIDGDVIGVVSRLNGTDTVVENGSFNGTVGDTFIEEDTVYRINIDYTNISAQFYIDDILIHTITNNEPTSATLNLPITITNINSNGLTTDVRFDVRFAVVVRLGELNTEPISKFISTNATTICKYGAGKLLRIVNLDNAGSVTIYDNTAASGTQIAVVDTAKALGDLTFGAPFSNGLTVVTAGGAKISVIYE